jgi:hypothetical protein
MPESDETSTDQYQAGSFNSSKHEIHTSKFKNPILTLKTQCFSITKIKWVMLINAIIRVYSENHNKPRKYVVGKFAL